MSASRLEKKIASLSKRTRTSIHIGDLDNNKWNFDAGIVVKQLQKSENKKMKVNDEGSFSDHSSEEESESYFMNKRERLSPRILGSELRDV